MSIHNKSDAELEALSEKAGNDQLTEEETKDIAPQEEPQERDEFLVEVDEDPNTSEDNSKKAPPSPTDTKDNQQKPTKQPTPKPVLADAEYQNIVTTHPQLAKFKNDENFLTNLAKSYVELESKIGKPKEPTVTPPPITDEQKLAQLNQQVSAETERIMLADPIILDNLTIRDDSGKVIEMLSLPRTDIEWTKFKREYPAEWTMIYQRGQQIYNYVHKITLENEQKIAFAPQRNLQIVDEFIDQVAGYFKKLAPNASEDDMKVVADKLREFNAKALPDARYYIKDGRARFLNLKMLLGDFLAENPELATRLAEINAKNSVHDTAKNALEQVSKKASMKTLANSGLNTSTRKQVNVLDRKQLAGISDEHLARLAAELEK